VARTGPSTTTTVAPGTVSALLRKLAHAPPRELARPPALKRGQMVGRFEIVREIGRGGFGVVFEARDREGGEAFALKALRLGGRIDLKGERLLKEAEAAARLSHPNIVAVRDVVHCDERPCLVLELLQGCTLGERLARGPISVLEALRIGVEVAKGIAHAHGHGVIHRDLTPGNVFLCDEGQVKILDFGMAHAFGRRKLEGGTRAYMAPEQCRGAPEDERTDVFALGIVLHEMLSGKHPFAADTAPERFDDPPWLEIRGAPTLAEIVRRMLEKDPVDRPRDGEEVLTALVAVQERLDRHPPPALSVRVRRPSRRRVRAALLVASSALVAAVLTFAWSQKRSAAVAARPEGTAPMSAPARRPEGQARPEPPVVSDPVQPQPAANPARIARPIGPPSATPRRDSASAASGAGPVAPRPRVRYCRDSIGAVSTPPAATGEGVLTIAAEPYGRFFIDGKPHGETPGECLVTAGAYVLKAVHPELGTVEAKVNVGPGRRVSWTADFLKER
jgi:serine/threonine protein kinase